MTRFVISIISQDVHILRRKERIIHWRNVRHALLEELSHVKKMWPLCSGNVPSPPLNANLSLITWSGSFPSHTYLPLPSGHRNLGRQRASVDRVWLQWQVCSVSAMQGGCPESWSWRTLCWEKVQSKYLWRSVCLQCVLHEDHSKRQTVSIWDSHDSCVVPINELLPCCRPNSDRVMIHLGGYNCAIFHTQLIT